MELTTQQRGTAQLVGQSTQNHKTELVGSVVAHQLPPNASTAMTGTDGLAVPIVGGVGNIHRAAQQNNPSSSLSGGSGGGGGGSARGTEDAGHRAAQEVPVEGNTRHDRTWGMVLLFPMRGPAVSSADRIESLAVDTTVDPDSQSALETFQRFRMSIIRANVSILIFASAHLLVFICFLSYRGFVTFRASVFKESYEDWMQCAFLYFDGNNPDSWKDICGEVPMQRIPYGASLVGFLALSGYGIWMSVMHFSALSRDFSTIVRAAVLKIDYYARFCIRWCLPSAFLWAIFGNEVVNDVPMRNARSDGNGGVSGLFSDTRGPSQQRNNNLLP
jgi:hypothetical protein